MSETENGRLGLHGTEHSKCNQLMTLGFKGLTDEMSHSLLPLSSVSPGFNVHLRQGVLCTPHLRPLMHLCAINWTIFPESCSKFGQKYFLTC